MSQKEFEIKWQEEKAVYEAWGKYIVQEISATLSDTGKDLESFFKLPAKHRLKDDKSLIDKAFYRSDKHYSDPYNEIEDKVGARFVVLLLEDIKDICDLIECSDLWSFDPCKHFDNDRQENPLLFTYQSVHYILRPLKELEYEGVTIGTNIACELQIRTLLQHAHAELTHDAIYKAKKAVQPEVSRTVAKCMALIETTDTFFSDVTQKLNYGPLQEHGIIAKIDSLYFNLTNIRPINCKSSLTIWDQFEQLLDATLMDKIQTFTEDNNYKIVMDNIPNRLNTNMIYEQSIVLFVYWMLLNKKRRLLKDWPLDKNLLQPLANDLGVSIEE